MKLSLLTVLLSAGSVAQAGLITAPPAGGTTTVLTNGPGSRGTVTSAVVAGFTITGDTHIVYGDFGYGLAFNGRWEPGFAWVGGDCFSSGCTAVIDLGGLYGSVGGFMNYVPDFGDPVIAAIAADGVTVLESYNLAVEAPISTPAAVNAGAFRGISREMPDIAFFRISGSALIMHDITLPKDPGDVPEPGTMALAGAAIVGLLVWRRKL